MSMTMPTELFDSLPEDKRRLLSERATMSADCKNRIRLTAKVNDILVNLVIKEVRSCVDQSKYVLDMKTWRDDLTYDKIIVATIVERSAK